MFLGVSLCWSFVQLLDKQVVVGLPHELGSGLWSTSSPHHTASTLMVGGKIEAGG